MDTLEEITYKQKVEGAIKELRAKLWNSEPDYYNDVEIDIELTKLIKSLE